MTVDPRIADEAARTLLMSRGPQVARTATYLRSREVRDVMARMLSPGLDFIDFRERLLNGTAVPPTDEEAASLWIAIASAVGHQGLEPQDLEMAIAMFALARIVLGASRWRRPDAQSLAQLLWFAGRPGEIDEELLARMPEEGSSFLAIDLIGAECGVGSTPWLDALNGLLVERGVAPISIDHDARSFFDGLGSTVRAASAYGPLVSVVMPAFRPGADIQTAVRSIVEQTWADLELLIVDDGSGSDFAGEFERLAGLDPRIRMLSLPANRGTYAARNRGLEASRGEFITFHDTDDWAHPERIERQLQPLLDDADLLRTHSVSIRASAQLVFQHPGQQATRSNASSHLFRRSALDHLGRFDWVRKSGDTEFDRRFEAALPDRQLRMSEPLAFVRLDPNSLSRSDFTPGWELPDRSEYVDAYLHWHRAIELGADPYLPADPRQRPLTAPRAFLLGTAAEPADPELLVVADWAVAETVQRASLDEIAAAAATGTHIGLVQARSLYGPVVLAPSPRLSRAARQIIASGQVQVVSLEEPLRVRTVLVVQPEALQFPSARPVRITADHVVLVDNGFEGTRWARADVERVAAEWFDVVPEWRPRGGIALDPGFFRLRRTRFRSDRPVVGWIAEVDGSDLPETADDLIAAYPVDATMDVRLVGVEDPFAMREFGTRRSWLTYGARDVTAREFWNQVDFAVAVPSDPDRWALERTVGEALASGCVVILTPEYAAWFGDAVVSCEPPEIAATVFALRDDREAYVAQVDRGRTWARARLRT